MPKFFRSYIFIFTLTAGMISLPLISNLLFMSHADEFLAIPYATEKQLQQGALYLPVYMASIWQYKLALARMVHPEILLLGSSISLHVHQDAFSVSFINGGAGIHSLREGVTFLEHLLPYHRPRVILLGVDFYWFNPNYPVPDSFPDHDIGEPQITWYRLFTPFIWLAKGQIMPSRYFNLVLDRNKNNVYENFPNMGGHAIVRGAGFLPDGSFLRGSQSAGMDPEFGDRQFEGNLKNFYTRKDKFVTGNKVSEVNFGYFLQIAKLCRQNGVQLVVFLTPISATMYQKIQSSISDFSYTQELRARLPEAARKEGFEYYDFFDIRRFGSNDCECYDGVHVGETAYYKLLKWIAVNHPTSVLRPYLQLEHIDKMIQRFEGHALALADMSHIQLKESDFLGLGCLKKTPPSETSSLTQIRDDAYTQ